MKPQIFKTVNRLTEEGKEIFDNHIIDGVGNHFINGKCVNPKKGDLNSETGKQLKIGETYPPMSERIYKNQNK